MNLFHFLNKARKEGVDLTKIHIRMTDSVGGWKEGFQIASLRGNRLSVRTANYSDIPLQPGHDVLKTVIGTIEFFDRLSKRTIVDKEKAPAIVVSVSRLRAR